MKKLLFFIAVLTMMISTSGCIMLKMHFNEDGFSFGVEGDIPDIPAFDYEKEIK